MLKIKIIGLVFISLFLSVNAFSATDIKSAFKEADVSGQLRLQYYERDYDIQNTREDIAAGGMFYYRTAPLYGVKLGVAFYTGQGMGLNDSDKDVYGLLNADSSGNHDSYAALGEAFISFEKYGTVLKAGRQELEIPWINGDDNRFTPQSVFAYTLVNNSLPDFEIFVGHITKMKGKASENFDSMTNYAGIMSDDKGVTVSGLTYSGVENLKLQIWDFFAHEYFYNIYFKADYEIKLTDSSGLCFALQYLDQNSTGRQLGGVINTYAAAAEVGYKISGFKAAFGYAEIDDQDVAYPWGHDFLVSAMTNDSSRADETSYMGTISYDFKDAGIPGLSIKVVHADFDTPDSGVLASPDLTETDLDVKYKLGGAMDGMALRFRYGIINKDEAMGGEDYDDFRLYVTYSF